MYPNLEVLMKQKGISLETLASVLHVHRNTAANKLNGDSDFTYREARLVADAFFPEYKMSYIFKLRVEEPVLT